MTSRNAARMILAVLGLILGVTGCSDSATEPANADQWDGRDTFSSHTLSSYSAVTESGPTDIWSIADGRLIAKGQGDVVRGLLLREDPDMADGRLEFESDRLSEGGLVFRYQDLDDYYLLAVRDDSNPYRNSRVRNYELYHAGQSLARIDLDIERGQQHRVTVEFVKEVISLYLNGELIQEIHDQSTSASGLVGLHHGDHNSPGEESRFDVFRWKALD